MKVPNMKQTDFYLSDKWRHYFQYKRVNIFKGYRLWRSALSVWVINRKCWRLEAAYTSTPPIQSRPGTQNSGGKITPLEYRSGHCYSKSDSHQTIVRSSNLIFIDLSLRLEALVELSFMTFLKHCRRGCKDCWESRKTLS